MHQILRRMVIVLLHIVKREFQRWVLKSKPAKKKGFTYEELCKNTGTALKEIPQKTYQNLIWGCYFKPYKSN